MGSCISKRRGSIIDLFKTRNNTKDLCFFSCIDENINTKSLQHTWMGMHYLIQSIPEEKNSEFTIECIMMYLLCIGRLLSCVECGDHWIILMKIVYKYRNKIFNTPHEGTCFLFDLHNFWNKLNRHSTFTWEQYKEKYNYNREYVPMLQQILSDSEIKENIQKLPGCKSRDIKFVNRNVCTATII
jgi:hypothetical protein